MTCGEAYEVTGGLRLVCDLDAGHDLPHAMTHTGVQVARWPVAWTEADEASWKARRMGRQVAVVPKSKRRRQ